MSNFQNINTHIGNFEATATSGGDDLAPGVLIRTPYDPSALQGTEGVTVRKIAYQVGVELTQDGDVRNARISRLDGKAVSDSARQVILDAAKGVFGAYIESQGKEVFDLARLDSLKSSKRALQAQMDQLSGKMSALDADIAQIEERLTSEAE